MLKVETRHEKSGHLSLLNFSLVNGKPPKSSSFTAPVQSTCHRFFHPTLSIHGGRKCLLTNHVQRTSKPSSLQGVRFRRNQILTPFFRFTCTCYPHRMRRNRAPAHWRITGIATSPSPLSTLRLLRILYSSLPSNDRALQRLGSIN